MNLININNQADRLKYIKAKIEKNENEFELAEDYYDGEQWSKNNWATRSGFTIPSANVEQNTGNPRIKVTNNLIKKVVDELADYTVGDAAVKTIITNSEDFNKFLYHNDNDIIVPELIKDYLKYNGAFTKTFTDIITNKQRLVRLNPEYVFVERDELDYTRILSVCVNQEISLDYAKQLGYKPSSNMIYEKEENEEECIYTEYWNNEIMAVFINGQLIEQKLNTFNKIPVECIGNTDKACESYVRKLIDAQDIVNINYSLEMVSNAMNLNPLTFVSLPKDATIDSGATKSETELTKSLNVGAGGIIVMDGEGTIQRISSEGVNESFIKAVERYVEDFYSQAKVSYLKPSEANAMSGYAIKLLMNQTIKFVNILRNKLTTTYENIYFTLTGKEDLVVKWSPLVFENFNGLVDQAVKYYSMEFSKEYIMRNVLGVEESVIYDELTKTPAMTKAVNNTNNLMTNNSAT